MESAVEFEIRDHDLDFASDGEADGRPEMLADWCGLPRHRYFESNTDGRAEAGAPAGRQRVRDHCSAHVARFEFEFGKPLDVLVDLLARDQHRGPGFGFFDTRVEFVDESSGDRRFSHDVLSSVVDVSGHFGEAAADDVIGQAGGCGTRSTERKRSISSNTSSCS
jgi:hypothetical protein